MSVEVPEVKIPGGRICRRHCLGMSPGNVIPAMVLHPWVAKPLWAMPLFPRPAWYNLKWWKSRGFQPSESKAYGLGQKPAVKEQVSGKSEVESPGLGVGGGTLGLKLLCLALPFRKLWFFSSSNGAAELPFVASVFQQWPLFTFLRHCFRNYICSHIATMCYSNYFV